MMNKSFKQTVVPYFFKGILFFTSCGLITYVFSGCERKCPKGHHWSKLDKSCVPDDKPEINPCDTLTKNADGTHHNPNFKQCCCYVDTTNYCAEEELAYKISDSIYKDFLPGHNQLESDYEKAKADYDKAKADFEKANSAFLAQYAIFDKLARTCFLRGKEASDLFPGIALLLQESMLKASSTIDSVIGHKALGEEAIDLMGEFTPNEIIIMYNAANDASSAYYPEIPKLDSIRKSKKELLDKAEKTLVEPKRLLDESKRLLDERKNAMDEAKTLLDACIDLYYPKGKGSKTSI